MSRPAVYLVNPAPDFPLYHGAEIFAAAGLRPAVQMADLALPTLAALVPASFDLSLCDASVRPVDWETDAPFIGITGKLTQHAQMLDVAQRFRARGKTIIMGGPHASLSPELLRPHCDVLVRGEIEEIAPLLFSDLERGRWEVEYVGNQPDLRRAPLPRWDLYPLERALMATVQTSRGCPFPCELCDLVEYAGRTQRHKEIDQVLMELDHLHRRGMRSVFLADDNLTVYRSRAIELLLALRTWNAERAARVSFTTQLPLDLAHDEELLRLCAEAGVETAFVGLDTPTHGPRDVEAVQLFSEHGIAVMGGLTVGFDGDDEGVFQRQLDFATAAGIPFVSVGALVAPPATRLHARLAREGRLRAHDSHGRLMLTNIIHPRLPPAQLLAGLKWLTNSLYRPDAFADRLLAFIDRFGRRRPPRPAHSAPPRERPRSVELDVIELLGRIPQLGRAEERLWSRVTTAAAAKPAVNRAVVTALLQYLQVRHMYQSGSFWEPHLAEREPAPVSDVLSLRRSSRPLAPAAEEKQP